MIEGRPPSKPLVLQSVLPIKACLLNKTLPGSAGHPRMRRAVVSSHLSTSAVSSHPDKAVLPAASTGLTNFSVFSKSNMINLHRFVLVALVLLGPASTFAQDKPNILVLMPDDVGWQNVSDYGLGTMGYRTPHIDRIAAEGALFTDHYAQPSCTAGRAAFITGQYPIRSGMTTVGRPGGELGLKPESHSLAEVLKPLG